MIHPMPSNPAKDKSKIWRNKSFVIESSATSSNALRAMTMPNSNFTELKGLGATAKEFTLLFSRCFVTTFLPVFCYLCFEMIEVYISKSIRKINIYNMKDLNSKQKRHLRALAHQLKPVVIVGGGGLTDGVISEIDQSIEHHELIKVRINAADRQSRRDMIQAICRSTHSTMVFNIGHIAAFYRPATKPIISLPK